MSARGSAAACLAEAAQLVADVKAEDLSLDEARRLLGMIAEARGWLESARALLTPGEVL